MPATPSTPRALLALLGALLLGACFDGEALAYAPCQSSEACRELGLAACVIRPALPEAAGFCAPACATPCPAVAAADTPASCLEIAGENLCVLTCSNEHPCPEGHACTPVSDDAGERRELCFPEEL